MLCHFGRLPVGLTKFQVTWCREQYLADKKGRKNLYASPLLAENPNEVPPAFALTGEVDVVRGEGEL